MIALIAQKSTGLGGNVSGIGPLGLETKSPRDFLTFFPQVISTIVGVLTAAAILWFIIQFMLGAFKWISSGGDSKQIEGARNQIVQAIVGLVIIFAALVLLSVLGGIFGLDILDLKNILLNLSPAGPGFGGGGGGGNTGP